MADFARTGSGMHAVAALRLEPDRPPAPGAPAHAATRSFASDAAFGGPAFFGIDGPGTSIVWTGGAGKDTKSGTNLADYLDGAGGDDHLSGLGGNDILHGGDGDDTLKGGSGDDDLYGWQGADQLFGGAGNDYIVMGRPDFFGVPGGEYGSDFADGGADVDAVVISWWNQLINGEATSITLDFGNGDFTVHGGGSDWEVCQNFEQLSYYGSDGGDIITGGPSDDFFYLGAGDDVLKAKGGNDYIYDNGGVLNIDGGDGIDTLRLDTLTTLTHGVTFKLHPGSPAEIGGALSGTVKNVEALYVNWNSGTPYADKFGGGDYADTIYSGAGNDKLDGGGGGDHLAGGAGDDVIHGGDGNDNLEGGGYNTDNTVSGSDTIYGEGGSDVIHGGADGGTLYGGAGIDDVTGNTGADVLYGGAGDDHLDGGGSHDKLYGGAGNDRLGAGEGADRIYGGSGNDTVDYDGSSYSGVTVDLLRPQDNTFDAAGDTYKSIENITGSYSGNDTLRGTDGANVLNGIWGDDVLEGRGGRDTLIGDSGQDTASYLHAPAAVVANLASPHKNTGDARGDTYSSIERLEGSRFNDRLTGDANNNGIDGGAGNDTVAGGAGADRLTGGTGRDTFVYGTAADSTGTLFDTVTDFNAKQDHFKVHSAVHAIDGKVAHGSLEFATFDADLRTALSGHLHAGRAILFTPNHGGLSGHTFLIVDQNGHAGYQTGADIVIDITGAAQLANLSAADFTT